MRFLLSAALAAFAFAAQAAPAVPSGVSLMPRGDGWWFVDGKGLVLYTYERDERTPGKSDCNADCATTSPPLAAPADAKPVGDWSLISRLDGSKQCAYRGKPIYTY